MTKENEDDCIDEKTLEDLECMTFHEDVAKPAFKPIPMTDSDRKVLKLTEDWEHIQDQNNSYKVTSKENETPEKIYLQLEEEGSWCDDRIHESDTEYVRSDKLNKAVDKLQKLCMYCIDDSIQKEIEDFIKEVKGEL